MQPRLVRRIRGAHKTEKGDFDTFSISGFIWSPFIASNHLPWSLKWEINGLYPKYPFESLQQLIGTRTGRSKSLTSQDNVLAQHIENPSDFWPHLDVNPIRFHQIFVEIHRITGSWSDEFWLLASLKSTPGGGCLEFGILLPVLELLGLGPCVPGMYEDGVLVADTASAPGPPPVQAKLRWKWSPPPQTSEGGGDFSSRPRCVTSKLSDNMFCNKTSQKRNTFHQKSIRFHQKSIRFHQKSIGFHQNVVKIY